MSITELPRGWRWIGPEHAATIRPAGAANWVRIALTGRRQNVCALAWQFNVERP